MIQRILSYVSVSLIVLNLIISLLFIVATIYKIGFDMSAMHQSMINMIDRSATITFTILMTLELIANKHSLKTRGLVVELIIYALLLIALLPIIGTYTNKTLLLLSDLGSKSSFYIPILLVISVHNILRWLASTMNKKSNPTVLMAISFFVIIIIGTAMLMMPNATYNGISTVDALFVSTS
ncbi:MAG: hypothetical protein RR277_08135, partial [Rikenellaceae bacterium]